MWLTMHLCWLSVCGVCMSTAVLGLRCNISVILSISELDSLCQRLHYCPLGSGRCGRLHYFSVMLFTLVLSCVLRCVHSCYWHYLCSVQRGKRLISFQRKAWKKPLYLVSTKWQTHTVIIAGEHRYSLQEVEETKNGAKTGWKCTFIHQLARKNCKCLIVLSWQLFD